jgi:pilus assembly protein CpaB
MNSRVTAILVVALLFSGSATYLVYRVTVARAAQPKIGATPVVVAASNLAIGTLIKDADLSTSSWVGTPPKGTIAKKETIVGRGVIAPIFEGEPIMENRLAAQGAGGGLAATIPPGMRAVAVRVNDIVGVAGFVVAGMTVDVLISGVAPGSAAATGPKVKTILQNIQVLSAGQNYQKDAEGKPVEVPVVNLLVTPEQAEVLSLASNETRIQLVLRNPLDTKPSQTSGAAMAALFGDAPAPAKPRVAAAPAKRPPPEAPKVVAPPPPPAPVVFHIEVFNGALRSESKFTRPAEEKK